MIERITEDKLDRMMDRLDRYSRVMAWAAAALAVLFIIVPALIEIWGR